ncbi:MAG: hypothetical protein JSU63_05555 [Phycisphaerales bacterium]|nr:MAG: hypothetical protein JSU63_05555 [Phycisphaerales bacterium]
MLTRRVCCGLTACALLALVVAPAFAGEGGKKGRHRVRSGASNVGHLYLVEKDPETWDPIKRGAWGKMTFRMEAPVFDFVFNGHHLEADWSYTLIYYPDPWPGDGLICLGEGVADEHGDVHIQNEVDTGSLPAEWDDNYDMGAKIWLVASADVDCDLPQMIGWAPTEYLFEWQLITYTQTEAGHGHSNVGHLNLYTKDPDTWEIIEGAPWGRMKFDLAGPEFDFVFNGHLLAPDAMYTLLYYPDPWPGDGLMCLGNGMVDEYGDVHIKAAVDTGTLPAAADDNYGAGAKIWLVLSDDVDCDMQQMIGWNPTMYLFEEELITYTDTD